MSIFIIIPLFVFMVNVNGEIIKDYCLSSGSTCMEDSDCCSDHCMHSRSFFPVCSSLKDDKRISELLSIDQDFCLSEKSECTTNADCCSNNCDFAERSQIIIKSIRRTCIPKIKNPPDNLDTETTDDGPKICKLLHERCMINDDCCSKKCIKVSIGVSWDQFCIAVKPEITEDHGSTTTIMPEKKNNSRCSPMGSNCFANVDCCSKKCLNYPGTTFRSCS